MTTSMILTNSDLNELLSVESSHEELKSKCQSSKTTKPHLSKLRDLDQNNLERILLNNNNIYKKSQPKITQKYVSHDADSFSDKINESQLNNATENKFLANSQRISFVKNICNLLENKMVILNNNSNDLAIRAAVKNKNKMMSDDNNKFENSVSNFVVDKMPKNFQIEAKPANNFKLSPKSNIVNAKLKCSPSSSILSDRSLISEGN